LLPFPDLLLLPDSLTQVGCVFLVLPTALMRLA